MKTSKEFKSSFTVVNETEQPVFDRVETVDLSRLGIDGSALSCETNVAFFIGEEKLSVYFENGTYFVRIPEIPAGSSVTVTVLYGGEAETVFDGGSVFEITGGNVFTAKTTFHRTCVIQCPNGELIAPQLRPGKLEIYRSSDGGEHWELSPVKTNVVYPIDPGQYVKDSTNYYNKCKTAYDSCVCGLISDKENGAVFMLLAEVVQFVCQKLKENGDVWLNSRGQSEQDLNLSKYTGRYHVWKSEDNGYSWREMNIVQDENVPVYVISYANGVKTCVFDGAGENVDYVFVTAGTAKSTVSTFFTQSLYSTDGGNNWQFSRDRLNFGPDEGRMETGNSEPTVCELEDGRLMMIMRNQFEGAVHFARSYSSDHGKSWTPLRETSLCDEVFTVNTQPLLDTFRGHPILLWGGNNVMGGHSYKRFPFNIAVLDKKDGAHVLAQFDISLGNPELQKYATAQLTNPALHIFDYQGKTRLVAFGGFLNFGLVVIRDLQDYIDRTGGVFDSFEEGTEGWVTLTSANLFVTPGDRVNGTVGLSVKESAWATAGKSVLAVDKATLASRSFARSVRKGTVSFDFLLPETGGVTIELQTAFNGKPFSPENNTHPYLSVMIGAGKEVTLNGKETPLSACAGVNHLGFTFDEVGTVRVTLNGAVTEAQADLSFGNLVSFLNVRTNDTCGIELDNVRVTK